MMVPDSVPAQPDMPVPYPKPQPHTRLYTVCGLGMWSVHYISH